MAERNKNTWYIAKVVSIDDPDKRRRIQVRGPKEGDTTALPDDKLPWLQPWQFMSTYFALPNVDESVLILTFGEQDFWIELPDKSAWSAFGDDYATAWLITHKDVFSWKFTGTNGFEINFVGDITVTTNKTTLNITDDEVHWQYDAVDIKTDGKSCTVKVKDVEFSTDGTLVTLKNGSKNLATVLDELEQALIAHTHQSSGGPTSPPINVAKFTKNKADFNALLK